MSQNVCEERTYQALFESLSQAIRNFIYYKGGDLPQAEDITQEAFLRLWKACVSVHPNKAKSYLYTIANNLFLDQIKHQKVVLAFQQKRPSNNIAESPEYLLEEQEFKQQLEQAIAALPENNRVVFLMNRIEKMTYQEIADRLGLSKKAVEKRMSKALLELRKLHEKI